MVRPYRLQAEKFFYHITSRGDNRKNLIIGDYDFEKFFDCLFRAKEKCKFNFFTYCLISNHYHLFFSETLSSKLSAVKKNALSVKYLGRSC